MRVLFMGTPDFAVPSLQALLDRGHEICGVFTRPDKPKGRGHKLQATPVKELALQYGLPVYQPATLRSEEVQAQIVEMQADAIAVVAYGNILPRAVLDAPRLGCVNVHGSLLPEYRGAAPIQRAVLDGRERTGVTTQFMAEAVDAGDILLQAETAIGPEETAGELFDRLKILGADLLVETLERLEQGQLTRIPQDHERATMAPMLNKAMSQVDWTQPAQRIHDQIRGLNPWPCVIAELEGRRIKLLASQVLEQLPGAPGDAVRIKEGLAVVCGQGALLITELQTDKGKRMNGKDYLLGHPLHPGAKFV